jgi:hypothetical protein
MVLRIHGITEQFNDRPCLFIHDRDRPACVRCVLLRRVDAQTAADGREQLRYRHRSILNRLAVGTGLADHLTTLDRAAGQDCRVGLGVVVAAGVGLETKRCPFRTAGAFRPCYMEASRRCSLPLSHFLPPSLLARRYHGSAGMRPGVESRSSTSTAPRRKLSSTRLIATRRLSGPPTAPN